MTWSVEERAKIVELFLKCGSIVKAQRAFRRETGLRSAPRSELIKGYVDKFRAEGAVARKPYHRAPLLEAKERWQESVGPFSVNPRRQPESWHRSLEWHDRPYGGS